MFQSFHIKIALLAYTLLIANCFAQSSKSTGDELSSLKGSLEYDLKKYETTNAKDLELPSVIEKLNNRTDSYVKLQKQQCSGEYSTVEINEDGEQKVIKKKLSKLEKNLCMLELVNFQRKFVEVVFNLRKALLVKQQEKQLDNLESYRQKQVDELEKLASQYK
jgi:hypothetical protein